MRIRLPRRDKSRVKTYKQTVVNAVILVVVLSLFAYVAIQLLQNFSTQVSTQRTQMVTDVTYAFFDGCIFKDGDALSSQGDIVHYLVPDGAKVGVGQAYAEVYSGTSVPADERADVERRLNDLSTSISMLESGLEGGKGTSSLGDISKDISNGYYAYIDSILAGDISAADKTGDKLLGGLIDYSAITSSGAAQSTLSALKEERAALLTRIGGTRTVLISDRSFTFYKDADGYEFTLNSSLIPNLNRDNLDLLINSDQAATGGTLGSAVYSSKWYIALPTDEGGYEQFRGGVGSTYEIEFLGADVSISMLLEAVVAQSPDTLAPESATDTENTEATEIADTSRSYLLFSSFDLARIAGLDRHQSVRITLDSTTGYRVPREAVHAVGEDRGVYVLVGNMIEFRRITIIGEGDGYYVVDTYEKDLADELGSEIPYLNINDLIVTSGRDLYDGKLLD